MRRSASCGAACASPRLPKKAEETPDEAFKDTEPSPGSSPQALTPKVVSHTKSQQIAPLRLERFRLPAGHPALSEWRLFAKPEAGEEKSEDDPNKAEGVDQAEEVGAPTIHNMEWQRPPRDLKAEANSLPHLLTHSPFYLSLTHSLFFTHSYWKKHLGKYTPSPLLHHLRVFIKGIQ